MVVSDSHLSAPSRFSIQNFRNSLRSSILKLTEWPTKETQKIHLRNPAIVSSSCHELQPNFEETQQIHAHLFKNHFSFSYQIPFTALYSYSSNAALFSFLVNSYIKNNCPRDAVQIYAYMRKTDTEVDNFIIPSVLKACCLISSTILGEEIHGFVVKNRLDGDIYVCNALIQMYNACGSLASARRLFDRMANKDVVSWSTMIGNNGRRGLLDEALELVKEMHVMGAKPSDITMLNMIAVFADLGDLRLGKVMHAYVVRNTNYGKYEVPLATSLIDMYVKCTNLAAARRVFDRLSGVDIASWTAMIAGYIHCNELDEGVRLFVKMLGNGIFPNEITMRSLIKECGSIGALQLGKQLHAFTLRNRINISLVLATALIDMYGKCGDATRARLVFDGNNNKDLMMWSAMISSYAYTNNIDLAFDMFVQMTDFGIRPNEVTMANLLCLCAKLGALNTGKWIHSYIDRMGIKCDMILQTSLLDMYAKCGDIDAAQKLFAEASGRDILMWNAMVSGFAMNGYGEAALKLLAEMERLEVIPNDITFIGALHACSHAGLVLEGKSLFQKMVCCYGLIPKIEHYGCMVDLLGRSGLLDEAKELINSMPMKPNSAVWGSLLNACKIHKSLELGEWVAKQFLSTEPHSCGHNVLMSNIYAADNRWGDVAEIRRAMKDGGMRKEPGISSIEVNGSIHDFVMGDKAHPEARRIYDMVAEMIEKLKDAGYEPNASAVLMNIDQEEKENALNYHSEKLAMAFGLINTAPGVTIRIVKNLRICDDCHAAVKLLSKIYGRVIIVRDRNRFHHFKEGLCSCCDYW